MTNNKRAPNPLDYTFVVGDKQVDGKLVVGIAFVSLLIGSFIGQFIHHSNNK